MEKIPPEIVTKILSHLDDITLVTCRQVCRRWWILSFKLCNPLYLPKIMKQVLTELQNDRLRSVKSCRLVCKFWKDALDKLAVSGQLPRLSGLTNISLHDPSELPHRTWNPFPTRIVRINLCHGHGYDNREETLETFGGTRESQFLDWFGEHISYLQVSLQHSHCAEQHLTQVLMKVRNLQGLIISESPSPFRFSKTKTQDAEKILDERTDTLAIQTCDLGCLKFFKLDDSDTTLKYTEFYRLIIEKSPNLEHLELNGYHHVDMGIIRLLSDRQSSRLCLTHLKLDAEDPNAKEILEILNKTTFHLKYFSIKVNGFGDNLSCAICTDLLHGCLRNFAPTLERLELKLFWFEKDQSVDYPLLTTFPSSVSLKKLERLKVVGFHGPFDFIKDLCNLKALLVVNGNVPSELVSRIKCSNPYLNEIYSVESHLEQGEDAETKRKIRNFMYKDDSSFMPKYCGLCQEEFP